MFLMLEVLSLWKELGRGWKGISNLSRLSVEATLPEVKRVSPGVVSSSSAPHE